MKKPPTAYTALRQPVLAKMKSYQRDFLVHDRRAWRQFPGVEFLHFTRETGTTLVFLFPHDHPIWPHEGVHVKYLFGTADRWHILTQISKLTEYECGLIQTPRLCYHGRSGHVVAVTPEDALNIAHTFEAQVRGAWGQQMKASFQTFHHPMDRYEIELEAA
jgi:hypothetical protein